VAFCEVIFRLIGWIATPLFDDNHLLEVARDLAQPPGKL
jgi:hypothetical protein